jgi:hypothetical protein
MLVPLILEPRETSVTHAQARKKHLLIDKKGRTINVRQKGAKILCGQAQQKAENNENTYFLRLHTP